MSIGLEVKIEGAKLLQKKLTLLPAKVGKKIIRQSLRKGAKISMAQAKVNALTMIGRSTGDDRDRLSPIAKKIAALFQIRKQQKKLPKGQFGINVQLKEDDDMIHYALGSSSLPVRRRFRGRLVSTAASGGNSGYASGRTYIPAAIEFGHKMWAWGRKIRGRKVPPIPYYRKAWDSTKHRALKTSMESMLDGVEQEAKRA